MVDAKPSPPPIEIQDPKPGEGQVLAPSGRHTRPSAETGRHGGTIRACHASSAQKKQEGLFGMQAEAHPRGSSFSRETSPPPLLICWNSAMRSGHTVSTAPEPRGRVRTQGHPRLRPNPPLQVLPPARRHRTGTGMAQGPARAITKRRMAAMGHRW